MQTPKTQEPEPMDEVVSTAEVAPPRQLPRALIRFGIVALVLCAAFSLSLVDWIRFGLSKERNTYLLLVPFVSLYLIWTRRGEPLVHPKTSIRAALVPALIAIVSIALIRVADHPLDRLSLQVFALLNLLLSTAFLFFGTTVLRQITFPVAFLIFAVPMPPILGELIEIFLQYTSAEAAYWLMSLANIPMIRDGINFRLPNLYIQVAQECSGYNSTFCLFMVSTVAGYMFLKSPSRRIALSLAVIPLAILRNGFRVTTLAALCVYDDPKWIDSSLHHQGGPLFFLLSLIPFFLLLWGLRKSEIAKDRTK